MRKTEEEEDEEDGNNDVERKRPNQTVKQATSAHFMVIIAIFRVSCECLFVYLCVCVHYMATAWQLSCNMMRYTISTSKHMAFTRMYLSRYA